MDYIGIEPVSELLKELKAHKYSVQISNSKSKNSEVIITSDNVTSDTFTDTTLGSTSATLSNVILKCNSNLHCTQLIIILLLF